MVFRNTREYVILATALFAAASCSSTESGQESLASACSNLLESSPTLDSAPVELKNEELSGMTDEEKTMWLEAAEDANKAPLVAVSFCELVSRGDLPGVESTSAHGEFSVSAARRGTRSSLEQWVAPARSEKKCKNLYYVELNQQYQKNLYFFCEDNSSFPLISAYKQDAGIWRSIK